MFVRTSVKLFRDSKLPSVIPKMMPIITTLDGKESPKKADYCCNNKKKCSCGKHKNKIMKIKSKY
tara:strand:- start:1 stop:195 length:195 start_codon:yes stop_codon:yes gene_type:complete